MKIGRDEWAASVDERREQETGWTAALRRRRDRTPVAWQFAIVVAIAAVFPWVHPTLYLLHVGLVTLLYALLALGLNVTVGFTGMLDLGYIAFYGFGAYLFGELSSAQFNIHWPTYVSVPLVVAATALLGLLVGLPSRRLSGDYLAIVTLFFGQLFVQLTTTLGAIQPPWRNTPINITGGPNGITGIDPMIIGAWHLLTDRDYYYVTLAGFVVVMIALYHLQYSRTGRAWIAVREDSIAAELMGIPVNRLRLLAFATGAAIAGFTGTIFAADQIGVFPSDFDLPLLILIYAAVVLGGTGSLPGVVLGAVFIVIFPQILTSPEYANLLFFMVLVIALVRLVHPWQRLLAILGGTIVLGVVIDVIVNALWPHATTGAPAGSGFLTGAVDHWVIQLANQSTPSLVTSGSFVLLIAGVLSLVVLRGGWRDLVLMPVLYLACFVWENVLLPQPSVTRQLIIGAMLVVLMTMRPQGLFGTFRVEPV